MTILTVLGLMIFISLGMWQLERADFKEAVRLKYQTRLAADYQTFDTGRALDDIEYQKLILHGQYDTSRSLLLDNQVLKGRAGYQVLSPFILSGSHQIVLVNRGWVALGESRETLPSIKDPAVIDRITGIASVPNTDGFRLGKVSLQDSWPQLIPFIDIDAMQPQFGNRLLPVVLWLAPEQAGFYQRHWEPTWADPDKSRAYAVQWFCFAFIAFVLYVVLNLRKLQ